MPDEVDALLDRLERDRPHAALEIGTALGGTLYLLAQSSAEDAVIISLDVPGGLFGGGYHLTRRALYESFGRCRQRLVAIRADSHATATRDRVLKELQGRPLDILLIDGDHSFEGVQSDYELYSPLVRRGGLIAIHDIVPGPVEYVGGVPSFWRVLRQRWAVEEVVRAWDQGGYGIGLVQA